MSTDGRAGEPAGAGTGDDVRGLDSSVRGDAGGWELDPSVRRRSGGRLLVGGRPARLLRLSPRGAAALGALLGGAGIDPTATAARALAARLVDTGLLHPRPGDGAADPPVTAVIPVLDGGEALATLVRTLAAEGPVIVVDDGSRDGSAERARRAGATVLPNAGRRGPAGARNTGLRAARTDLVAFLDADCEVRPGWRRGLAGLLRDDPELALLGPRVRSAAGSSPIARYERLASPLDLGARPGLVGPGRLVPYLPAAALIGRRTDLLAAGGFTEELRFGEDVDLVWRLVEDGGRVRFVPSREVAHRPRPDVRALFAQRAGYGASAPALAERHGRAAAPLRVGTHAAAIWTAAAILGPRALPLGAAASAAVAAARGSDGEARIELIRLSLEGNAISTRHLARAMAREWLPLGLAAAVVSRRGRGALLAALAIDAIPTLARSGAPRGWPRFLALHLADRAGYTVGLWGEVLRRRDPAALRPALTGRPR